jgi:hypothetical protein
MRIRRMCSVLLVVALAATASLASTSVPGFADSARPTSLTLAARENQIWSSPLRDSKFAAMLRASAGNNCEASQPLRIRCLILPSRAPRSASASSLERMAAFILLSFSRVPVLQKTAPSWIRSVPGAIVPQCAMAPPPKLKVTSSSPANRHSFRLDSFRLE